MSPVLLCSGFCSAPKTPRTLWERWLHTALIGLIEKKRMKSYKIIKKYYEDNGIVFGGPANPFHIYNQYLYFDAPLAFAAGSEIPWRSHPAAEEVQKD